MAYIDALRAIVTEYVDPNKIGVPNFEVTTESTSKLIDKIGLIVCQNGMFDEKLPELNGPFLRFGKTIEEYYPELILPVDGQAPSDDSTDWQDENKPAYVSFRKNFYSYTLGRKKFYETVAYNDFERAVNNSEQLGSIISVVTGRLQDSENAFRYETKKALIGVGAKRCLDAMASTTTFTANTKYDEGTYLRSASSGTIEYGIVVKNIPASTITTWADAKTQGYIVKLNLTTTLAVPTDATSGEDFIMRVQDLVEIASNFITEGYSLNGNTLGLRSADGLTLYLKNGIKSKLNVKTWAGAFNLDKAGIPVKIETLDTFGADADAQGVYAVLCDNRTFKLCDSFRLTLSKVINSIPAVKYTRHSESTAYMSNNTFIHTFVNEGGAPVNPLSLNKVARAVKVGK